MNGSPAATVLLPPHFVISCLGRWKNLLSLHCNLCLLQVLLAKNVRNHQQGDFSKQGAPEETKTFYDPSCKTPNKGPLIFWKLPTTGSRQGAPGPEAQCRRDGQILLNPKGSSSNMLRLLVAIYKELLVWFEPGTPHFST